MVGDNTFDRLADGSFKSTTQFNIGKYNLHSSLTGHLKDGKLADSTSETTTSEGSRRVVTEGGHVTVSSGGQSASLERDDKGDAIFPSLHPQLFASGLVLAEKAIRANSGTDSTVLSVYDPQSGMSMALKVVELPVKTVKINGKDAQIRTFRIEEGGSNATLILNADQQVIGLYEKTSKVRAVADGWDAIFEPDAQK